MSEIRYDRLNDTYVLITPERLHRPDFSPSKTSLASGKICPFCEGNESLTPKEIYAIRPAQTLPNSQGWQVRVVPNLYKALAIEAPHHKHEGGFSHWEGFGAHEVIIDTPKHLISMMQWDQSERINWLKTLRQRTEDLRRDSRLIYFSLFKNEGFDAGATMEHCHTQLIALPIVPNKQRELNHRLRNYFETHHETLISSIIKSEESANDRIIAKRGEFIAFSPYASGYPFEVMITSETSSAQIDTITDESIGDLSTLIGTLLVKMESALGKFAFNLSISSPPLGEESSMAHVHRMMIRITPRLYRLGGFEVDTGMMINPVEPELAAKILRGEDHG